MIGTNLPVVINSNNNLEFVIVGLIDQFEGIIVKSSKTSSELIAHTKRVYNDPEEHNLRKFKTTWSPMVIPPFNPNKRSGDRRPVKLLLSWRKSDIWMYPEDEIKTLFDFLAQDLYNIAMQIELTQHEKDHLILWLLSPLIERLEKI